MKSSILQLLLVSSGHVHRDQGAQELKIYNLTVNGSAHEVVGVYRHTLWCRGTAPCFDYRSSQSASAQAQSHILGHRDIQLQYSGPNSLGCKALQL